MHVLVTGGAGFVGSHVADLLVECGHRVRLLDVLLPAAHDSTGRPDYLGEHEMVQDDVRDPPTLDRALRGIDAVSHQAAMVGLGVGLADMPFNQDGREGFASASVSPSSLVPSCARSAQPAAERTASTAAW